MSLGTRSVLHYEAESALFRRIILRQGGQPTGPIASCSVRCFVLHVLKPAPRRFEPRNILNESLQGKMTHLSAALEASIFLGRRVAQYISETFSHSSSSVSILPRVLYFHTLCRSLTVIVHFRTTDFGCRDRNPPFSERRVLPPSLPLQI